MSDMSVFDTDLNQFQVYFEDKTRRKKYPVTSIISKIIQQYDKDPEQFRELDGLVYAIHSVLVHTQRVVSHNEEMILAYLLGRVSKSLTWPEEFGKETNQKYPPCRVTQLACPSTKEEIERFLTQLQEYQLTVESVALQQRQNALQGTRDNRTPA